MGTESDAKKLFERYSDMIYRIAMSYGYSVHFAEDAVQEVFLRYLKKRPCFENIGHEKAWFIRVTVNCCKSMLSSAWMKRVCPLEEAEEIAVPFREQEECELYEELSYLPAKYRIVLYLRYYEEYQVKEIAAILGITPNLVSARLLRAKKLLRQKFLKQEPEQNHGQNFEQNFEQNLKQNFKIERKGFRDETGFI